MRWRSASGVPAWHAGPVFDWPDRLDPGRWCMSPELVSLHGTDLWHGLGEPQQRELSCFELVNFFSLVLRGGQPLGQGRAQRLRPRRQSDPVSCYLHHFLDEENRHLAMFERFCNRYAGKAYLDDRIAPDRTWEPGEEHVVFFCKVLVVGELEDFYSRHLMHDARVEPIVRELNRVQQVDGARRLAFGRALLRESFERWSPRWSPATLRGLREWLVDHLRAVWGDFCNPTMYADSGFADGSAVRAAALASPAGAAHRARASARLLELLRAFGILDQEPEL